MNFIDREKELETLNKEYKKNNSFVILYGRRRVGKTTLIKNMVANLWLQSWVRPLSIVSIYRNMYVEVAT